MLEDQCLFDNVGDEDKRILLLHLFSAKGGKANWGWKVNGELTKLAAKCGRLVRNEAERYLTKRQLPFLCPWNDWEA